MKDNTIGHCRIQIDSVIKPTTLKTSSSSAALLTGRLCRDCQIGLSLLDLHFTLLYCDFYWLGKGDLFNVNNVNTFKPTGSTSQMLMGFVTDASADARLACCATHCPKSGGNGPVAPTSDRSEVIKKFCNRALLVSIPWFLLNRGGKSLLWYQVVLKCKPGGAFLPLRLTSDCVCPN